MSSFSVTLVETKVAEIEVEATCADEAVRTAKTYVVEHRSFEGRLGAVLCARVKSKEDQDS